MKRICGAKLRGKDRTCQKSPMANGRCRLHGGLTPSGPDNANYKHGRYAAVFKGQLADKFKTATTDLQPLDILPELAVQRSLLSQYIETTTSKRKMNVADVERLSALAQDVIRSASMIAKMRNDEALTVNEIKFLQAGILRLLERYVPDTDARRNFIQELRELIPQRIDATPIEPAVLPIGAGEAVTVT
jgi:hypothetical protein